MSFVSILFCAIDVLSLILSLSLFCRYATFLMVWQSVHWPRQGFRGNGGWEDEYLFACRMLLMLSIVRGVSC